MAGTKSAPREITLENSIMPRNTGHVRVSTPPRVITLNDHHFPSASDEPEDDEEARYFEPKTLEFNEDVKRQNKHNSRKTNQANSQDMVINHR
jgi:CRISPR/Cas system-associated endonuclease/helicase Cas3